MSTALSTVRMTPMTDPDLTISERFTLLDQRRLEMGVTVERLSARAGYKTDQTWRDLRNGKRPLSTLEKFEAALDWIEEHPGEALATQPEQPLSAADDLIEVELEGNFGVRVVVRAHAGNSEAMKEFAREIIREMRGGPTGPAQIEE